jgi:hypothetical protein
MYVFMYVCMYVGMYLSSQNLATETLHTSEHKFFSSCKHVCIDVLTYVQMSLCSTNIGAQSACMKMVGHKSKHNAIVHKHSNVSDVLTT